MQAKILRYIKINSRTRKGSALAFSLIILSIMLSVSINIANVAIKEKKSANASAASNKAFHTAESGLEVALQNLATAGSGAALDDPPINCVGDPCNITGAFDGGTFTITFTGLNGENLASDDLVSNIDKIKSVGEYSRATRAIRASYTSLEPWCEFKLYTNIFPDSIAGPGWEHTAAAVWRSRNDGDGQLEIECVENPGTGLPHSGNILDTAANPYIQYDNIADVYTIEANIPDGSTQIPLRYSEAQDCTLTVSKPGYVDAICNSRAEMNFAIAVGPMSCTSGNYNFYSSCISNCPPQPCSCGIPPIDCNTACANFGCRGGSTTSSLFDIRDCTDNGIDDSIDLAPFVFGRCGMSDKLTCDCIGW